MRELLMAGAALLALAASDRAAHAVPFYFTYAGNLVTFTVTTTGPYQILAFGAQGGNSTGAGGRGAEIGVDFSLTGARHCRSPLVARAWVRPLVVLAAVVVISPVALSPAHGGLTGPDGGGPIFNGIPTGGTGANGRGGGGGGYTAGPAAGSGGTGGGSFDAGINQILVPDFPDRQREGRDY
jgi:hypothetical protein